MDTTQTSREETRKRSPKPKSAATQQQTRRGASQKTANNTQRQAPQKKQQAPEHRQTAQKPRQHQEQQHAATRIRTEDMPKRTVHQGGPHQRAASQSGAKPRPVQKKANTADKKTRTLKQNPLQNFISGIKSGNAPKTDEDRAEQARKRREQRAAAEAKKKKQAQRHDTPAVIYTEPKAFNRNKLLVQLLSVTAVVAALVIGLSIFFKVEHVTVAGAESYDEYRVKEASGISEGDNLLTFSRAKATAQIIAELPYVDTARIGIKLPDTVIIYIEELDVSYAIKSGTGDWWLINSAGRVVDQINGSASENYTQVLGVTLESPVIGEDAIAQEEIPTETDPVTGEPIPLTVTGAQRMSAALQILNALEANDIVGEAATVDVSRLDDIILWYGSRYQVNLGDTADMEYKIACMNDAILQLSEYESGILDISFINWEDQVGFTPFA